MAEDLDRFVDPFEADRYNRYATVGENLLFGKAIGDTFREDRLAGHPFIRAILEAEDLTKPLARMGLSIATSMIEIFAEIPDGHPLFERFSFFSASDRPYFEDLVERRRENRRGVQTGRDQERLIGLALRYNESRHRLGLIDEALEARIVTARADLARMLPVSLQPAIEFYDASRLCAAASVQDNLLFGRVAADQAGAQAAIQEVIRRVLTDRGLDAEVARIGLNTPIDLHGRRPDLERDRHDRSGALPRAPARHSGGAARARRPADGRGRDAGGEPAPFADRARPRAGHAGDHARDGTAALRCRRSFRTRGAPGRTAPGGGARRRLLSA